MAEIVKKAIQTKGLSLHDVNGHFVFRVQVTGNDHTTDGRELIIARHYKGQPYEFPSEEVISHWFCPGGGASFKGLTDDAEFLVRASYDVHLDMPMP